MGNAAAADSKPMLDSPDSQLPLLATTMRLMERFGLPVAILLLVLWWARTDVVQPLLDAHFTVVNKIVDGQQRHSDEVKEVGKKIDRLIEIAQQK